MSEMTPLCGYNMGAGTSTTPMPMTSQRTFKTVTVNEGGIIAMPDDGKDGFTQILSDGSVQMVYAALPQNGDVLQISSLASMEDIAGITFTGGTVLNPPTELLENQTVRLQRIDKTANIWITLQ